MKPLRALIVEDSADDCELLVRELERGDYDLTYQRVQTGEAMTAALGGADWDIVLSDYSMPMFSGPAALGVLQTTGYDVPFIIISGTIGEETAVTALKAGAHDFLVKGRLARLLPAIERELRDAAARRDHARLEDQLRQAQKMEAIGQLAGGVAHDFNNMLTVILGYTALLTEQIGPDKSIGRDLREIQAAAERAASLTRQLLAFSRKQVLAIAALNLTEVARTLEPMLRRLLGAPMAIEMRLDDALDPVMGDVTQLEHLLINLSVNARDAMPEGGVLTIATGNAELDADYARSHPGATEGSFATLSVSDTGVGMSPDVQARIFEPFFTTKEAGRGTGLGLAAVYGTVKQLGGYIAVESELGRGSTFTIYLPKTERSVQPMHVPALADSPVGGETILLVEDEMSVRAFTKIVLQRFGYRVLDADSAEAALTLLKRSEDPMHLLLTDVMMSGMRGPALAARARHYRPDLKVVYMSGYTDWGGAGLKNLTAGDQFLQKPFTAQALLSMVRAVLGPVVGRDR